MDKNSFIDLLDKYITHSITPDEKTQLSQLLHTQQYAAELETIIDQQLAANIFETAEDDTIRQLIFERIQARKDNNGIVRRIIFWRRIAVAASILLVLGLGSYLIFFNKTEKPIEVVKTDLPNDVKAPETNRAMITLANGSTVYLDSAANGALAVQGNINLIKTADGKIVYSPEDGKTESPKEVFNTLTNPRGSKVIDMTLADGSHVWLNAGSSVTYPIAFVGSERKVTITGEAYFEVAHNAAMPFKVNKGEIEVTVLGTHFNINAYEDEADIKVTLLEGSVRVGRGESGVVSRKEVVIKPGQQAVAMSNGQLAISNAVDTEQVMAWKNGLFSFDKADLQTVMRELARWYDIEVVYEKNIPVQRFWGSIQRTLPLSKVLLFLEKSEVHFRIEGRKLIVIR